MAQHSLRADFPFREILQQFVDEYRQCPSYWYIPKARALNDDTIADIQSILRIILDEFLGEIWNQETQDKLLERLVEEGILEPYKEGERQDRTALPRIYKRLFEVLGLLWVQKNSELIITDAGFEMVVAAEADEDTRPIIEGQIAKWQYPNPSAELEFDGILPHLFLLQVLQQVDYQLSTREFELFVNLAREQDDVERIVRYVSVWRDLNEEEQDELLDTVRQIPMAEPEGPQQPLIEEEDDDTDRPLRYTRITQNASYQRAFYTYPSYLAIEDSTIVCASPEHVDTVVQEQLEDLKIPIFSNIADWFAYYGDPEQQPSWYTYLSVAVQRAASQEEAREIVEQGIKELEPDEAEDIERQQIEKGIEDFYVERTALIEAGLQLLEEEAGDRKGRQFSTPIGPMDLLCRDSQGRYVVVEIKADEARDSVFGQILRYIGWVQRNLDDGRDNVRGIILAGGFPESARYSRIGLEPLSENYNEFLRFEKHGFNLQTT